MDNHLDNPQKTEAGEYGRAIFFYWLESVDINKIERTWLNVHVEHEGRLPVLNSVYSPTST